MTLSTLTLILASLGVVWTAVIAFVFWRDPVKGMVITTHHLDQLPQVMTDRYFAFVLLALGAVIYGDLKVVAFLFAVFSFMGFADAAIYRPVSKPIAKHLSAGIFGALVSVVALLAVNSGVTA